MLGDIVCNQLLVNHLVVTFSVGDHGRYAMRASGPKQQNEHGFSLCLTRQNSHSRQSEKECSFCCLGPHVNYIPRMSWLSPTEHVVTKWVIKSWVLQKMSSYMGLIHRLFESHRWSSQLCTWADFSFVSVMSVGECNNKVWQHCSFFLSLAQQPMSVKACLYPLVELAFSD